jgi:hypothetical protein
MEEGDKNLSDWSTTFRLNPNVHYLQSLDICPHALKYFASVHLELMNMAQKAQECKDQIKKFKMEEVLAGINQVGNSVRLVDSNLNNLSRL